MSEELPSNISIYANVWADVTNPDLDPGPYAPLPVIPGDLRVNLLQTRDTRALRLTLTPRQYREYSYCRFFASYGQEGTTFEK